MVSASLRALVRCPECHGTLAAVPDEPRALACDACGRRYLHAGEFLDLRPAVQFPEQTRYLDEALHADARHERVSPPLLGSRIRNDMLRAFLDPRPEDIVVDLGCGSGRALLWNGDWNATTVGVDIAPFFSAEARRSVDLLLADLRKLPFAGGTFTKAYSLDVLEHLSPESLREMLGEASRVLKAGGRLFVYTHVRKNARIAIGLRWVNALAHALERAGLIDLRQERLRKSDHVNPLRDIPELEAVADAAGFRVARIRYYTPIIGGLVENVLMRVAERAMARRASGRLRAAGTPAAEAELTAVRDARRAAKSRIASSRATYLTLLALSYTMKIDLLLFGRVRSGPFFALLEKKVPTMP